MRPIWPHSICRFTNRVPLIFILSRTTHAHFNGLWVDIFTPSAQVLTCGWWAALTLTNCNKVRSSIFWKSSPIQRPDEHQKKNFHPPVSELPAKQHGRHGPFGLYRLHCLATNSETGQWKFSLMIIWSLYGWKLSEKWTPNFVAIRKG